MSMIVLAAVLALSTPTERPSAQPDLAPHGRYVEARTASVFAGACHFGSEESTAGREALLAWHFEGGAHAGVDLAGVDAVVVIAGDDNLAAPCARRARLYLSDTSSEAQRKAVQALLEARLGATLGRVEDARVVALSFTATAETFALESKGLFALSGSTLPDRACCKMPYYVWYAPLAPVEKPLVAHNDAFRFADARLGRVWSRPDENASFTGTFRFAPPAVAAR